MRDKYTYSLDWDGTGIKGPTPIPSTLKQWNNPTRLPRFVDANSHIELNDLIQYPEFGLLAYARGYIAHVLLRPFKPNMLESVPYIQEMKKEFGDRLKVIISSGREKSAHIHIQEQTFDNRMEGIFDHLLLDTKGHSAQWKGEVAQYFVNQGSNFVHVDNDWLPFWLMAQINAQFPPEEMPCLGYLLSDISNRFLRKGIREEFSNNNIHIVPDVLTATLDLQRRIRDGKFTDSQVLISSRMPLDQRDR